MPSPEPVEPSPEEARLFLSAAYCVQSLASDEPASQGAAFGLSVRVVGHLYARLRGAMTGPIDRASNGIRLELSRYPVHLGGALVFPVGRVRLGASLLLGLDVMKESVRAVTTTMEPVENKTWVQVAVLPELHLAVRVVGTLSLFASAGMVLPFNRASYSVDTGTRRRACLSRGPSSRSSRRACPRSSFRICLWSGGAGYSSSTGAQVETPAPTMLFWVSGMYLLVAPVLRSRMYTSVESSEADW